MNHILTEKRGCGQIYNTLLVMCFMDMDTVRKCIYFHAKSDCTKLHICKVVLFRLVYEQNWITQFKV